MSAPFLVGLTRDLRNAAGEPTFGAEALARLDQTPGLRWEYLPEAVTAITPELTARYDALYVNSPRVGADSFGAEPPRVKLIARHGVGYDSVDVAALSARGVLLTNTPDAVRRPVATMALTLVLALAQKLLIKDGLTRSGRWNERVEHMGQGLTGKTLGLVGAGGIGLETIGLARAFDLRVLAADPYADAQVVAARGGTLVPLETLLREADFVVLACLLNPATHHLINAARLALMKRSAYLINVARGPIIDEAALIACLQAQGIAGAALDVFEQEPVAPDNPLLAMDNVITTPHSLCWTDECFGAIARSGLGAVVDVCAHTVPTHVVNREVLAQSAWRQWFAGPPAGPV
jgi:phosphoglycerate dehydrogenase-like enzyme